MFNRFSLAATAALVVGVSAVTAAAAPFYVPVNLVPFANEQLQSRDTAFPKGSLVLGGVPFYIDATFNNVWSADGAGGANPRVLQVPVNLNSVREVYTLINLAWGQPVTGLLKIEFTGTGGAFHSVDLVSGVHVRDWNNFIYQNTITSPDTTNVVSTGGGQRRVDMQKFVLPASFNGQDLLNIRIVDTGGTNIQRALVQGLSIGIDQPAPRQWQVGVGGNGHRYQAVQAIDGISWTAANAAAIAAGGHLATITSAAENGFVYSFVGGNQAFWRTNINNDAIGAWLGGTQASGSAEPAGGWGWVTGEAFSFTDWSPNEPNNVNGGEDRLQFFGAQIPASNRWNDYPATFLAPGYIIEFEACSLADVASDSADTVLNPSGEVGPEDLEAFVNAFIAESLSIADVASDSADTTYNPNGSVGPEDLEAFVNAYIAGC